MYFTLAVSAATQEQCAALADRARGTDPRVMPIPGPATVAWRSPDGRAALLHWGRPGENQPARVSRAAESPPLASQAGTIWAEPSAEASRALLRARTSLTRVDPVYVAGVPGGVILSDRAMWAASAAGRLGEPDPLHACALLGGPGYPLGGATPFAGIRAADGATSLEALGGSLLERPADVPDNQPAGAARVAAALIAAVAPLRSATEPVELSLTGGKDSRLVVAALVAAGVPVRARTHGFPQHPDVVVAAEVARVLGIKHDVRTPATPEARIDVATRIRATVLVADGMLSAFENVGRPDHSPSSVVTAGGHGGELLRGGYAETAAGGRYLPGATAHAKRAARAIELLRRLTTGHVALLRPAAAAGYVASLRSWGVTALSRGPLHALDDFYLVNRAGRWSAAARQAYLLRENLVQPLFDDGVVQAARAVPLAGRVSGALPEAVLRELGCPSLADVPYAGKPAKGSVPETFDWRRQYGDQVARFLRDYTMDLGSTSSLFDVISPAAAEKALALPHADRSTVWALATMACLASGDYRNARADAPLLSVELPAAGACGLELPPVAANSAGGPASPWSCAETGQICPVSAHDSFTSRGDASLAGIAAPRTCTRCRYRCRMRNATPAAGAGSRSSDGGNGCRVHSSDGGNGYRSPP
ncbi:MAG TPA: asparagine synthase-related protein [Trebonia sp.]|nr:asparagine synthase-related protein [Trebonia sp.]